MKPPRRPSPKFQCASLQCLEDRTLLSTFAALHHRHAAPAEVRASGPAPVAVPVASSVVNAANRAHTFLYRLAPAASVPVPAASSPPSTALTPAELRNIYGLNKITNLGQGQTIAIVDAYDDPYISKDADTFDKQFMTTLGGSTSYYTAYGAATSWLTKVYASGKKPAGNRGWGQEISLDVEWMHAIAPQAQIMLVEASSASYTALFQADSVAVKDGATVISNSWGGGEFSGETGYDSTFSTKGVTFVFSAGDSGVQEYPAESPNVLAVGGTTLSYNTTSYTWTGESGWSGGGGGVSAYEGKPSFQSGLSYSYRANPDISWVADPNTGVAVYDSYGGYRWGQYGGTSVGAPSWSALLALANQGRVAAQKSVLDGVSQTLPAIYAMASGTAGTTPLYDVTTGSNGVGSAGPGYDLVTGRGTPQRADLVYQALVNY